jgi:PAS domain-containing protein
MDSVEKRIRQRAYDLLEHAGRPRGRSEEFWFAAAAEAIQASDARYRAIVDSSPAAIICIDETGIVQSANPTTMTILGYEAEELLGANVSKIMPDYHASRHDGYLDAYRRLALEAAETGAFLTRRLLSLGRKRRPSLGPVNLNDRISETFGLVKQAMGQQISIQLDFAPDLWPAVAEPAEIDSAVLNLVLNSRDAMPRGGEIRIRTRNQRIEETLARSRAGDFVCLVATDNGRE